MKKTGNVVRMKSSGERTLSSDPPRRHAPTIPSSVPVTNAITVVTPTRATVQGSPWRITSMTGCREAARPNWPVRQLPRYWR